MKKQLMRWTSAMLIVAMIFAMGTVAMAVNNESAKADIGLEDIEALKSEVLKIANSSENSTPIKVNTGFESISSEKEVKKHLTDEELETIRKYLKLAEPINQNQLVKFVGSVQSIGTMEVYDLGKQTYMVIDGFRGITFYIGEGVFSEEGRIERKKADRIIHICTAEPCESLDGNESFTNTVKNIYYMGAIYSLEGNSEDENSVIHQGNIVKNKLGDKVYINLNFLPDEFLIGEPEALWFCGQTTLACITQEDEIITVAKDYGHSFTYFVKTSHEGGKYTYSEHYWYINTSNQLICINEENISQTKVVDENVLRMYQNYYVKGDGSIRYFPEVAF